MTIFARERHRDEQRQAVVLIHGLCSSSLEVRLFGRALREHGYRVVTPHVPGSMMERGSV